MKTTTPIDLSQTALVLIDLQKGITGMPVQPHAAAGVVGNSAQLAARFRAAGAPVVLVNVNFSKDGGDLLRSETDYGMPPREWPADWTEIVPELDPQPTDLRVTKHQWGAFYGTELDLQLRRRGIRKIVLCGIATHIGVESTARNAYELGYALVLVEDAMSAMSEATHCFPVENVFPRLGIVRSTAEVLAACVGGK